MRIALLLPALLLSAPAMAHRWVETGIDDGSGIYVDANTMRRNGDIVEAWALIDETVAADAQYDGEQRVRARHHVLRVRFDCAARRFGTLSVVTYASTDRGTELSRRDTYALDTLDAVEPNTDQAASLDFACAYMRAEPWALDAAQTRARQPGAGMALVSPQGGFLAAMEQQRLMRELPLADGTARVVATVGRESSARPGRVFKPSDVLEATATITPELPGPATITAHWFAAGGSEAISVGRADRLLEQAPFTETFLVRPTPTWPVGAYRVELRVNEQTAATVMFEVR